jgi:ABC-type transport system involved in cytochrome c biogenesis ATPase subunit
MPTSRRSGGQPSPAAVSTVGLRKSYGDKTVLDGIDLRIPAGSVFALLGPNGAGKTTAVKILSTLISADGGQAQVAGHDVATSPDGVRAAIGVTGQFSAVDGLITGEENMLLMADLHHLSKPEGRRVTAELLERLDLVDAAKRAGPGARGVSAGIGDRRLVGQVLSDVVAEVVQQFLRGRSASNPSTNRPARHRGSSRSGGRRRSGEAGWPTDGSADSVTAWTRMNGYCTPRRSAQRRSHTPSTVRTTRRPRCAGRSSPLPARACSTSAPEPAS